MSLSIDVLLNTWNYAASRQLFGQTASSQFTEAKQMVQPLSVSSSPRTSHREVNRAAVNGLSPFENAPKLTASSDAHKSTLNLRNNDLIKAAASRAEYCLVQRRALAKVQDWRNWRLRPAIASDDDDEKQNDESCDQHHQPSNLSAAAHLLDRLQDAALSETSSSVATLKRQYEVSNSIEPQSWLSLTGFGSI